MRSPGLKRSPIRTLLPGSGRGATGPGDQAPLSTSARGGTEPSASGLTAAADFGLGKNEAAGTPGRRGSRVQPSVLISRNQRLREMVRFTSLMEAAPGVGAIPDLEIRQSPEYFQALDTATRVAKSQIFPGSESAFYDAMRTAQLVADASAFQPSTRPEPASSAVVDDERLSPEAEAEAITRIMSTAYEEESWRRVMNACMLAAGALVLKSFLSREDFKTLYGPFSSL